MPVRSIRQTICNATRTSEEGSRREKEAERKVTQMNNQSINPTGNYSTTYSTTTNPIGVSQYIPGIPNVGTATGYPTVYQDSYIQLQAQITQLSMQVQLLTEKINDLFEILSTFDGNSD